MSLWTKLFGKSGAADRGPSIHQLATSGSDDDLVQIARIAVRAANAGDRNTLRTIRSEVRSYVDINRFTVAIGTHLTRDEQLIMLDVLKRADW